MKPCFETRQLPRCRDAYGDIIPPHRARTRATPPARTGGRDSRWARPMEAPADEIDAGRSMPAPAATLAFTLKIYTPPTLHLESASALDPCEAPCRHVYPPPLSWYLAALALTLGVCAKHAYHGRGPRSLDAIPHALSSTCPGTCVGLKTHPGTDTCSPW